MSDTYLSAVASRSADAIEAVGRRSQGGIEDLSREALMVALGACVRNAPIPTAPDSATVAMGSLDSAGVGRAEAPSNTEAGRVFCVSDLHTDHVANLEWCRALSKQPGYKHDVLIVAGDVTSSLVLLRETLELCMRAFANVFYVPGNHDMWVNSALHSGGLHVRAQPISSLHKLEEIREMCRELGVQTSPAYAGGAIIAPVLSWYHASWDREPDVVGWDGIMPPELVMRDFHACVFPPPLSHSNDSIARHFDALNDAPREAVGTLDDAIASLRAQHPHAPLITFSHFVPHPQLYRTRRASEHARALDREPPPSPLPCGLCARGLCARSLARMILLTPPAPTGSGRSGEALSLLPATGQGDRLGASGGAHREATPIAARLWPHVRLTKAGGTSRRRPPTAPTACSPRPQR